MRTADISSDCGIQPCRSWILSPLLGCTDTLASRSSDHRSSRTHDSCRNGVRSTWLECHAASACRISGVSAWSASCERCVGRLHPHAVPDPDTRRHCKAECFDAFPRRRGDGYWGITLSAILFRWLEQQRVSGRGAVLATSMSFAGAHLGPLLTSTSAKGLFYFCRASTWCGSACCLVSFVARLIRG